MAIDKNMVAFRNDVAGMRKEHSYQQGGEIAFARGKRYVMFSKTNYYQNYQYLFVFK